MGDVLTAADMNTWTVPLAGVKSANQNTQNSTFINDADMRFAVAANAIYEFHVFVRYSSGTGQDFKQSFSVPAAAEARYNIARKDLSGNYNGNGDFGAADVVTSQGATVGVIVTAVITGIAYTGGTAGNLIYQWAQNVSGAFNCTLYQYSWLTGRRIG